MTVNLMANATQPGEENLSEGLSRSGGRVSGGIVLTALIDVGRSSLKVGSPIP